MNIDGDYLWDRTGEPDPEIQELEEILGKLRYQPRPLEIPAGLQVGRERSLFRDFGLPLAIAATIIMLLLGVGIWFGLQRLIRTHPTEVAGIPKTPQVSSHPTPASAPSPNEIRVAGPNQERTDAPRRHRVSPSVVAHNSNRRNQIMKNPQLAVNEREGEAAKDQLMLALRLASAKLSFAQKKTQSTNSRDLIHNQHKIG